MIKFSSLKSKITIFFLILTSIYFILNLILTLLYINDEKREDLRILLSHALSESLDYVRKYQDKTNLDFLYDVPHMTSVLEKSGAREISFFFSEQKYKPKNNEITVYKKLPNGSYFNLKSNDSEVKKHIIDTAINLALQHLIYLIIVGILGIYFINKLLMPLSHLEMQCKNYQDGSEFYLNSKNVGSEILQIKNALNVLIARLASLRKKDQEIFAIATHELKTPLAIIKARVEKFSENKQYAKDKFIAEINEDIKRLYLEIRGMLYFNVFDFDQETNFSVKHKINEILLKLEVLLKSRKLRVVVLGDDFEIMAREKLFYKMFMAIIENAITYAKEDSTIELNICEKSISIKNEMGSSENLFSSKLGNKILEKLSGELNFEFSVNKNEQFYEVSLFFK